MPYWEGTHWSNGTEQFAYSYLPSTHFVINQFGKPLNILFHNQNITIADKSIQIYDEKLSKYNVIDCNPIWKRKFSLLSQLLRKYQLKNAV